MVCVFAVFGTLSMPFFKQFGVGLAVAILLDATIVRAVLLPATMKLLGERNWYLPAWLEWLPQLEHRARATSPSPPSSRAADARSGAVSLRPDRRPLVIGSSCSGSCLRFASGGAAVSVPPGRRPAS
jgi:RND superfamily putative drug exporter